MQRIIETNKDSRLRIVALTSQCQRKLLFEEQGEAIELLCASYVTPRAFETDRIVSEVGRTLATAMSVPLTP